MNARLQILVIDDDARLLEAVTIFLDKRGYAVHTAADGREGLQRLMQLQPDLVVLDIMMPVMDGWEMCRRVREVSDTPIIMLTARGQEYDKVKGLRMGADDYLVKPFSLRELEARIAAILRRRPAAIQEIRPAPDPVLDEAAEAEAEAEAEVEAGATAHAAVYQDGTLTLDSTTQVVLRNDKPVALTAAERRLLFFLVQHAGRTLLPPIILAAVWGPAHRDEPDYVKLYIWRLRQKLEADPERPEYLLSGRDEGYRFAGRKPSSTPSSS